MKRILRIMMMIRDEGNIPGTNVMGNVVMNDLKDQEETLFREWKERYDLWAASACNECKHGAFIQDGVVDYERFLSAEIRICCVLKDTDQLGMPLVEFLRNGAPGNGEHTWNPLCGWLTGQVRRFTAEERADVLARVAVINIKKEDGQRKAHLSELRTALHRDKDMLKKQVRLYRDCGKCLFLCCGDGVFELAQGLFDVGQSKEDKTVFGNRYFVIGNEVVLAQIRHPQKVLCAEVQRKTNEQFAELMRVAREVLTAV